MPLVRLRLDWRKRYKRCLGDRYVNEMIFDAPDVIGWGKNGGFQALNLIAKARPAKIIMVGIDASIARGVHFHGLHDGLKNPSAIDVGVWRAHIDAAAPVLAGLGIEVVNASPGSSLTAYRKVDLYRELGC